MRCISDLGCLEVMDNGGTAQTAYISLVFTTGRMFSVGFSLLLPIILLDGKRFEAASAVLCAVIF